MFHAVEYVDADVLASEGLNQIMEASIISSWMPDWVEGTRIEILFGLLELIEKNFFKNSLGRTI